MNPVSILRALCASACLAIAAAASAATVGLHVGSRHSEPGYNDSNPGLHLRSDEGWTVGAYCNSESRSPRFPDAPRCRLSGYAGRTWQTGDDQSLLRAGVTAAAVVGYERAAVLPAVIPSLLIGGHARLLYAPRVDPKSVSVISLLIETQF